MNSGEIPSTIIIYLSIINLGWFMHPAKKQVGRPSSEQALPIGKKHVNIF